MPPKWHPIYRELRYLSLLHRFFSDNPGGMVATKIFTLYTPATLFAIPSLLLPLLGQTFARAVARRTG